MLVIVILILTLITNVLTKFGDWCDESLCTGNHIACNNDWNFDYYNCPADARILPIHHLENQIVDSHNKYRNQIAGGYLYPRYFPATRMATMTWDKELAILAELNVKTCRFHHEDCHATYRFPSSGQNLACAAHEAYTAENIIPLSIYGWFMEHEWADMSWINEMRINPLQKYLRIGHFLQLATDANYKVGCAAGQFTSYNGCDDYPSHENATNTVLFACNYAIIRREGERLYESGAPASRCVTGNNFRYPALCSIKEKYNVLD